MSVVMRSHNYSNNSERSTDIAIESTARRYDSERNAVRSKNFWSSYNNFILCNRSIELRITKLIPLQNVQYIVAFSKDFFDQNAGRVFNASSSTRIRVPKKVYTYETCYVICFVQFNLVACVFEMKSIYHMSDFRMSDCEQRNKFVKHSTVTVGNGFSNSILSSSTPRSRSTVSSFDEHGNGVMTISVLILSFCVSFLLYTQIDGFFL